MSDKQNIVVIGASVAGHEIINTLVPLLPSGYRLLLVDQFGFAFWPLGSLRAAVVPGWEQRVTAPLNTETVFPAGSPHTVIAPNKVVQLKPGSIVLEHPFEGKKEVPFFYKYFGGLRGFGDFVGFRDSWDHRVSDDYVQVVPDLQLRYQGAAAYGSMHARCILATGSSQPAPMRPSEGATEASYRDELVQLQRDIAKAKKVLVVGAGAVGLEMAGEIREAHPDKPITIIHSLSHVLNPTSPPQPEDQTGYTAPTSLPKLSLALEKQLAQLNIDLVLDDRVVIPPPGTVSPSSIEWDGTPGRTSDGGIKKVRTTSGKTIEADFVFVSIGNKPNSGLVKDVDTGAVKGGMIWVDEYLRVRSDKLSKYYAIGDCSTSPGWKTSQGAVYDAAGAAANIIAEVKGKGAKKYKRPTMHGLAVTLGQEIGSIQLTMPLFGTMLEKLLVEDRFATRFKGSEAVALPPVAAA
ncbi:hypothetical protein EHS25_008067 [Saitozyma podzolica]|uniref:FAD/NAD(P)-binding domain-containing protein n=1 Tax=Saitozyma podzolica TaxID=1890683 RepID=A0A427YNB8_9TREE|nr:hypothetical protein EHS25_008067 [Saitozyma podzolica]